MSICTLLGVLAPSCSCNNTSPVGPDAGACNPACEDGTVCRYLTCVPPPTACDDNTDCPGDQYCDTSAGECLPWGVGPGGPNDNGCVREPVPGVFFPGAQCEWLGPPAGDPFPAHANVLATPAVASFYNTRGEFASPSIVFTSYNFEDGGAESCQGSDPLYYGVLRIIDGQTCEQQASIAMPKIIASASVAIAQLGGDDAIPEIVAARQDGGLVAFTLRAGAWTILWETTSTFADTLCDWAGPSIHDLDDDGKPEVLFYGSVYDGATGATIDETLGSTVDAISTGYLPVAGDVDGDMNVDLVTGSQLYTWERTMRRWVVKQALPFQNGHTAIADFGTFPQAGADARETLDGIAEIVVIRSGVARCSTCWTRGVHREPDRDPGRRADRQGRPADHRGLRRGRAGRVRIRRRQRVSRVRPRLSRDAGRGGLSVAAHRRPRVGAGVAGQVVEHDRVVRVRLRRRLARRGGVRRRVLHARLRRRHRQRRVLALPQLLHLVREPAGRRCRRRLQRRDRVDLEHQLRGRVSARRPDLRRRQLPRRLRLPGDHALRPRASERQARTLPLHARRRLRWRRLRVPRSDRRPVGGRQGVPRLAPGDHGAGRGARARRRDRSLGQHPHDLEPARVLGHQHDAP